LKFSKGEQYNDAQLKEETTGHSKEEGSDMTKKLLLFGRDSQIV
jgi:hypothetical protein